MKLAEAIKIIKSERPDIENLTEGVVFIWDKFDWLKQSKNLHKEKELQELMSDYNKVKAEVKDVHKNLTIAEAETILKTFNCYENKGKGISSSLSKFASTDFEKLIKAETLLSSAVELRNWSYAIRAQLLLETFLDDIRR